MFHFSLRLRFPVSSGGFDVNEDDDEGRVRCDERMGHQLCGSLHVDDGRMLTQWPRYLSVILLVCSNQIALEWFFLLSFMCIFFVIAGKWPIMAYWARSQQAWGT